MEPPDRGEQGRILNEVAALGEAGCIRSTATDIVSKKMITSGHG